jgi:hypothetical protein
MDLKFDYETYQGVRHNLFLYSTPVLIITGFFTYFCILPPTVQQVVVQVLEYVSNKEPLKGIVGTAAGVIVFGGIAFLLTEIIQVHDQGTTNTSLGGAIDMRRISFCLGYCSRGLAV